MFEHEDKLFIDSVELYSADRSRRIIPEAILKLKVAYIRAVEEAVNAEVVPSDDSWSQVIQLRRALEAALDARRHLNELLGG